tara:strand:- start:583 stop:1134 length:552 start_codon:yes stop_codon:yes gene_type:complete
MKFIEDFKTKVGKWVFQRQLLSNKRSKFICNLEDARSVGILYDATDEENINHIKPFVSYFFDLKKEVKALGFVNSNSLSHFHIPKLQYDFFNKKDLNWYYRPQNYIIDNFVKKEYDILINLCDSSIIPMKYLIASSVARFKIGIYEKNYEIYDLMISLKDINDKSKLMYEIKHYVKLINKTDG